MSAITFSVPLSQKQQRDLLESFSLLSGHLHETLVATQLNVRGEPTKLAARLADFCTLRCKEDPWDITVLWAWQQEVPASPVAWLQKQASACETLLRNLRLFEGLHCADPCLPDCVEQTKRVWEEFVALAILAEEM